VWVAAGVVYLFAAVVAFVLTRWLPVAVADEQDAFEASSESAVAALANGNGNGHAGDHGEPDAGERAGGLERIATLLEEIEARREAEARRPS